MKEITEAEFEEHIREVIAGKKSRVKLTEELQTDWRTLNKKIQLLYIENPELYRKFIEKCSYKPREITSIPLKTMLNEFLKTGIRMQDLADKYGIGERTLRRKIDALKKSDNPEDVKLYYLCKETAYSRAHGRKTPQRLQSQIESLDMEPEEIQEDDVEKRRQMLLAIEKQYNDLCMTMSKTEAAKAMGYTSNRIYKLLKELYCMQIQSNTKKRFKDQIKVAQEDLNTSHSESKTKTIRETEKEI